MNQRNKDNKTDERTKSIVEKIRVMRLETELAELEYKRLKYLAKKYKWYGVLVELKNGSNESTEKITTEPRGTSEVSSSDGSVPNS